MRVLLAILLSGCVQDPADPPRRPDPDSDAHVVPPGPYTIPRLTLEDECIPDVHPATSSGNAGPGAVDPHEEVYGERHPAPFHVHLGWPSSDPSDSIAMLWRTDQETLASLVEITDPDGVTVEYEGASYLFDDQRIHEVRLCEGLEPGTEYSYRVGGKGSWSESYTFTTPRPPNSFNTFRVAVLGDSRGSYEEFGEILRAADEMDPDFFVFNGDMVDTGSYQSQWDSWFSAAGDILARKVLVPAHGNHEYLAVNYFAQFAMPNNEEWFSIRYGDLHLVSLNDTVRNGLDDLEAQAAYMRDVFAHTRSEWRMTSHHQPTWTACSSHPSNQTLRSTWGPVYDEFGVDVAMSGHNHIYERSVPIYDGFQRPPGQGTVYMVTGGAGAPLYPNFTDQWYTAAIEPSKHYVILDFGPDRISGQTFSPSGNVLDQFTIPR